MRTYNFFCNCYCPIGAGKKEFHEADAILHYVTPKKNFAVTQYKIPQEQLLDDHKVILFFGIANNDFDHKSLMARVFIRISNYYGEFNEKTVELGPALDYQLHATKPPRNGMDAAVSLEINQLTSYKPTILSKCTPF